jgi:hypothetical protein
MRHSEPAGMTIKSTGALEKGRCRLSPCVTGTTRRIAVFFNAIRANSAASETSSRVATTKWQVIRQPGNKWLSRVRKTYSAVDVLWI